MSEALTIGRMATELGVSTHTLRYYEQAGLLLPVSRTDAGHRLYARADIEWLRFVMRLKATGMSIAGMQAFAALRARGDETAEARLALLRGRRRETRTPRFDRWAWRARRLPGRARRRRARRGYRIDWRTSATAGRASGKGGVTAIVPLRHARSRGVERGRPHMRMIRNRRGRLSF